MNSTPSPIEDNHESKGGMLPTPVSPVTTNHDFESLISQFSIKETNHAKESDMKTYPCPECNQVFNRAHNLKSHRATHSATKPFQKLHTGERPYHCPICKRSFSRLDALNRHRKTEGGSACLKGSSPSSPKRQPTDISPLFIPSMTSQWQVLPSPSAMLTKPSSSLSLPSNTTTHHHSPPLLPSLILPLHEQQGEIVENLRQRIHDLEIENRVLRSLLCKNDETPPSSKKKLIMEEEDILKRQKTSS
ncbi:unnamed protein product [Mucor hiemalis]